MPPKKATKVATAPTRTSSRVKAKDDALKNARDAAVEQEKTVKPAAKPRAQTKVTTPKTTRKDVEPATTASQIEAETQETLNGVKADPETDVVELVSPPPPYTPVSASTSSITSDTKRKATEKETPSVSKKQKVSTVKSKTVTKPVESSDSDSEPEVVKGRKKKAQAASKKNTKTVISTSEGKNAPKKSKLDAWFDTYADSEHPEELQMEQLVPWWTDGLHLNIESAGPYVLAYKLELPQMDSLKRSDFIHAMEKHKVKNDTELRKLVEQEMQELTPSTTSDNFAKFYKKFFIMAKQAPESKSIPLDQAQVYWSMVLNPISYLTKKPSEEDEGNSAFPHAAQFVEFLGQQTQVKVINRDQWESFIRFNRDVGSDLTGYSEDSAWPSLYDAYAIWLRDKNKIETPSATNLES